MRTQLLIGLSLLGFACGDSETPVDTIDSGDTAEPPVECPAGTPEFAAESSNGLLATDAKSGLSVRLVDANYSPPAKNFNDWQIAVTDMAGAPASQVHIAWACAWMAVHGHGSNPKTIDTLGDGKFWLRKQNLSMYGGWQVQLWVGPDVTDYKFPSGGSLTNQSACQPSDGKLGPANITFDICVPSER